MCHPPAVRGVGTVAGTKRRDWAARAAGAEAERRAQPRGLQVPSRSHSSSSSCEENSGSSAAQPLLAGERDSPSGAAGGRGLPQEFLQGAKREDGRARSVSPRGRVPSLVIAAGKSFLSVRPLHELGVLPLSILFSVR